jgi:GlpG protein
MNQLPVIPLDLDLADFSRWLHLQGVGHRIVEDQGGQVLILDDFRSQTQVLSTLDRYISDSQFRIELSDQLNRARPQEYSHSKSMSVAEYTRATPTQAPVIFALILISIIFAFLSDFGKGGPLLRSFLIIDPFATTLDLSTMLGRWNAMLDMLISGQVWRLITPDFIHFNVMHITFNLLMLWVLGGQLEKQKGSVSFVALVIFVSIISNIAQLLETNYFFGGLSGVVYGLVGYCWLWKTFDKEIFFPDALMKFSIVWLLLGYTPLTEWLGWGKMANAAHLYGLLSGLLWAAITLYVNEKLVKKR